MKKIIFLLFLLLLCPTFIFAADKVEINTASLQQLDELTGVGPAIAQKIVDARPFSSVDDLLKVKGIGPKILQKIKDQGIACVGCQTEIAQAQQPTPPVDQTPAPAQTPAIAQNTATNSPLASVTPIIYPAGVFINEILPNPAGADSEDEWVELYNSNNYDADLSGWQLQDIEGTTTIYTIPQNTKILADSFLVFKRPDTKIMLNNDTDGLNLLTPDKKTVDSVIFTTAPLNQSYNKIGSSWQWSLTLTPGTKNIITGAKTATNNTKTLSNTKNSVKNDVKDVGLADISQSLDTNQENSTTNPWFLFFVTLAITIILSIIVLLIKLRFREGKNPTPNT